MGQAERGRLEVEDTRRGFQVLAAERSGLSKALNSLQVSRGKTMWPESVNLAAVLRRKLPLNRCEGPPTHLLRLPHALLSVVINAIPLYLYVSSFLNA